MPEKPRSRRHPRWWKWPLLLLLVPIVVAVLPLILAALVVWSVTTGALLLIVWTRWLRQGKQALVVYSNSPVWQRYFEAEVISQLGDRAVVINWSERKQWRRTVPVMLFRCLAPRREFNPMVIVFRRYRWPLRFQFYEAFRAFKHGRPEEVERTRQQLFQALGLPVTSNSAA
jgi:hypothetical protein